MVEEAGDPRQAWAGDALLVELELVAENVGVEGDRCLGVEPVQIHGEAGIGGEPELLGAVAPVFDESDVATSDSRCCVIRHFAYTTFSPFSTASVPRTFKSSNK